MIAQRHEHQQICPYADQKSQCDSCDRDNGLWYVAHVRSRHEKYVAEQLTARNVSHYLPLLEIRRKWSDRRKLVKQPLFPGYVFANISHGDHVSILKVRGVVQLVGANGTPWPVPADQIEAIRIALGCTLKCNPYPYLKLGQEVYVTKGPLKGHHGILIEKNSKHRLVLSIHLIGQSVSVEIDATDVEPL